MSTTCEPEFRLTALQQLNHVYRTIQRLICNQPAVCETEGGQSALSLADRNADQNGSGLGPQVPRNLPRHEVSLFCLSPQPLVLWVRLGSKQ
jgi:hypothetical protein